MTFKDYDRKWFFDNGYGASVIRNKFSYGSDSGLYELAVIQGTPGDFSLVYDTPITNNVNGWLTPREVVYQIRKVKALTEEDIILFPMDANEKRIREEERERIYNLIEEIAEEVYKIPGVFELTQRELLLYTVILLKEIRDK